MKKGIKILMAMLLVFAMLLPMTVFASAEETIVPTQVKPEYELQPMVAAECKFAYGFTFMTFEYKFDYNLGNIAILEVQGKSKTGGINSNANVFRNNVDDMDEYFWAIASDYNGYQSYWRKIRDDAEFDKYREQGYTNKIKDHIIELLTKNGFNEKLPNYSKFVDLLTNYCTAEVEGYAAYSKFPY